MKLSDFALLKDENIHPDVETYLRQKGLVVQSVRELQIHGASDAAWLAHSVREGLVVVTHDADFGTLAVREKAELIGIVYLRPGTIDPLFTIGSRETLLRFNLDVFPPFLLVVRRSDDQVDVRLCGLGESPG